MVRTGHISSFTLMWVSVVWFAGLAGSGAVWADEPASGEAAAMPTFADAQKLLQGGDFAAAEKALERLVAAEPDDLRAWRALGQAYLGAEKWQESAAASLRAAADESLRASALWAAARAQARLERKDEAIFLLEQLAREGDADISALTVMPEFAVLEEDPRFLALLPGEKALAEPFMESARVIHEWRGEAPGDSFGWIARRLGDVDGDGVADVVTSAVSHATGGKNAGRIYVYSGKSGARLWTRDGEEGFLLGRGVESAGDVDGDGLEDVVASAPGGDRAFVYSGKDGRTLLELEAAQEAESFGQHLDGAGDVDGDGHADILVGSPQNHTKGQAAGRLAVYSGKDGRILMEVFGDAPGARLGETVAAGLLAGKPAMMAGAPGVGKSYLYLDLTGKAARTFTAEISHGGFGGMFMSVVGDVDADGTEDLYISDWADGAKGPQTGRIYVFSGADGRRLLTLSGEEAGDGFGIGVADAGDYNGDGHADLVVGAWQHKSAASGGGKVYWISGKNGTTTRTLTSKVMGETFGFDTTNLGDVDGDGTLDFLLTSAWSPIGGSRTGRIFVIAGEK